MENKTRYISAQELFTEIEPFLQDGNSVWFTVTGSSMLPWIVGGRDRVEIILAEPEKLKIGDIVLFQVNPGKFVLHRIIRKSKYEILTAGDGNLHLDGWTPNSTVIAKVRSIQRKERIIYCNSVLWACITCFWILSFPFRSSIFTLLQYIQKYRGKRKANKNENTL